MRAKLFGAVIALAVFGTISPASAVLVTWEFQGVLSLVRGPTDGLSPTLNIGDQFSGSVTWNSDWATMPISGGSTGISTQPGLGFVFNIASHSFIAPSLEIYRQNPSYVQMEASSYAATSIGTIDGIPYSLIQAVLAVDGVPETIPIDPSGIITNDWRWFQVAFDLDSGQVFVGGNLTSLGGVPINANAVPLPAALPLFTTGLGVMGLLAWRRKRKAAAALEGVVMKTKFAAVAAGFAALLGCTSSNILYASTLIDLGTTVDDPITGGTWLKLSATSGQSYISVSSKLSDVSSPLFGFRYATGSEVLTLWLDAGVTDTTNTFYLENVSEKLAFIDLFGSNYIQEPFRRGVSGMTMKIAPTDGSVVLYGVLVELPGSDYHRGGMTSVGGGGYGIESVAGADQQIGSWLVKNLQLVEPPPPSCDPCITPPPINAVPLPAALPLFATGFGLLGLLGWRRKRKAAA